MHEEPPVGVPPTLRKTRENDNSPNPEDLPLALALSQNQFIGLASDRRKEAGWYKGWNHVAIAAVAKLGSRATVEIFDDSVRVSGQKSFVDFSRRANRRVLQDKHKDKWKSFARDTDIARQASADFRWWRLVEQPNPWQSGTHFRFTAIMQMRLHGIAVVWNLKNAFGKTLWRIPIPMSLLTPLSPGYDRSMPMGGVYVNSYGWMIESFGAAVAANRMMQYVANRRISVNDLTMYAYPHPFLPGEGASPTTAIESWLELAAQADKSQAEDYARGPNRKTLVEPPKDVQFDDDASLRGWQKRLDKMVESSKTGVIGVATSGVHSLTMTPDEMEYSQASQTVGKAILAAHGVPAAAVGMAEGMTFGAVAAVMRAFGEFSAQPDLELIGDEDNLQMRSEEGDALTIAYTAPTFDDPELKETQLQTDMQGGLITVAEGRAERGRQPYGDGRDQLLAGSPAVQQWGMQKQGGNGVSDANGQAASNGSVLTRVREMIQNGGDQSKSMVASHVVVNGDDRPYVIAVDLDGTLAKIGADSEFDEERIGDPDTAMVDAVRVLSDAGCKIVVYTCRDSDALVATWLDEHSVPFDAINMNPWAPDTDAKMMADMYLDARAVRATGSASAVMVQVLNHVGEPVVREAIRDRMNARRFNRMYGFLFVPVTGGAFRIAEQGRSLIKPEHLAGDGIEAEPHITILHAVAERAHRVPEALAGIGAGGTYTVGVVEVFEPSPGVAYAVVRLESPALDAIRKTCESSLAHVASEWAFRPHITIGQIDPRYAKLYDGRELGVTGQVVRIDRLIYRPPGEADLVIPLR